MFSRPTEISSKKRVHTIPQMPGVKKKVRTVLFAVRSSDDVVLDILATDSLRCLKADVGTQCHWHVLWWSLVHPASIGIAEFKWLCTVVGTMQLHFWCWLGQACITRIAKPYAVYFIPEGEMVCQVFVLTVHHQNSRFTSDSHLTHTHNIHKL